MNFIKRLFTGMKPDVQTEPSAVVKGHELSEGGDEIATVPAEEVPQPEPDAVPDAPVGRKILQIPSISAGLFPEQCDEVLIKAQPSPTGDQCLFTVNRPLMGGYSWYFPDFESAAESPLAEALFCLEGLETALVCESTLLITRKDKTLVDWVPFAKEVGAVIREALTSGSGLIAEKIISNLPSEDAIREGIQKVIDIEVNPGVAGHGGNVSLLAVKGNSVTIKMGGGCQGCSAADLTLKQGIHTSFRTGVPQVGAIFDETDHTAGMNPYFS